jgi:hypothetical protein
VPRNQRDEARRIAALDVPAHGVMHTGKPRFGKVEFAHLPLLCRSHPDVLNAAMLLLPDQCAILVGRAEIEGDAGDLVAVKG